uniref:No apical meristem-associated C-terminal domain-containing protein n=1 Tax=Populus davidiana TaxID=266767 RepID=A0A6M2F2Z2_9ROSI
MKREAKDHIKEEHLMSNLKLSDSEGNSTNEFGDRSDAENRGILFNDQIPVLHQADGDGTSIDAVPSSNLNVASKKLRKRKFGTSDGGKQQKVKIDNKVKFDEFGCKRMKNENTSMEAENELIMEKCARELNDLSRKRQTVEYLKEKCNEETAVIAELCMILINNGNEM